MYLSKFQKALCLIQKILVASTFILIAIATTLDRSWVRAVTRAINQDLSHGDHLQPNDRRSSFTVGQAQLRGERDLQ